MTVSITPAPADPVTDPHTGPVGVALLCTDAFDRAAAAAFLRARPEVALRDPDPARDGAGDRAGDRAGDGAGDTARPDMVLVLTHELTDDVVDELRAVRDTVTGPAPRVVLVVETVDENRLWRAAGLGLASVVKRSDATGDAVVRALLDGARRRGEMPADLLGRLLEHVRTLHDDPATGPDGPAFSDREIEILRLLAEGRSTAEVASSLNYSERTIKSAIRTMNQRLGLRNRSHAVARALRSGII